MPIFGSDDQAAFHMRPRASNVGEDVNLPKEPEKKAAPKAKSKEKK
jgi:hypothetical protein